MVQIFSLDGEEFEFKRDSLTIKKENNSFSNEFKVAHSSFPFLLIENNVAKKTLGSRDLTSVNKNKKIEVIVLEGEKKYIGELQQISVQENFRKCNLKYSSEVLSLMTKKMNTLMEIHSIIPGETNPIPFTEESDVILSGINYWESYPISFVGKVFPEVFYNFPMINWDNKFGIDLNQDNTWYDYLNYLNCFNFNDNGLEFFTNSYSISQTTTSVSNKNIPAPMLFLCSPLVFALNTIGWKLEGNFKEHELVKNTLIFSPKNNISKTIIEATATDVLMDFNVWESTSIFPGTTTKKYTKTINYTGIGAYTVKYYFKMPPLINFSGCPKKTSLRIQRSGYPFITIAFNSGNYDTEKVFSGEIDIPLGLISPTLDFIFYNPFEQSPIEYSISIRKKDTDKEFQQMHPTIDLNRYVPDVTFGAYLNSLKNLFNLNISADDLNKALILNFADTEVDVNPLVLKKSHVLNTFDLAENTSFVLKHDNDEDLSIYFSKNGIDIYTNQSDDFTKIIQTKFKNIPFVNFTSKLSEFINNKTGIGLINYTNSSSPYTAEKTNNEFTLNIPGEKGIFETFHKTFLKKRLNASRVEMTISLSKQEVSFLNKKIKLYIDNQEYYILSIELTENTNGYINCKLILESINI